MGNIAKLNGIGIGHDVYSPTPIIAASPTVAIDGKPAARVGAPLEPHDKPTLPSTCMPLQQVPVQYFLMENLSDAQGM